MWQIWRPCDCPNNWPKVNEVEIVHVFCVVENPQMTNVGSALFVIKTDWYAVVGARNRFCHQGSTETSCGPRTRSSHHLHVRRELGNTFARGNCMWFTNLEVLVAYGVVVPIGQQHAPFANRTVIAVHHSHQLIILVDADWFPTHHHFGSEPRLVRWCAVRTCRRHRSNKADNAVDHVACLETRTPRVRPKQHNQKNDKSMKWGPAILVGFAHI